MTTGRSGLHKTPYGTIEFTHTKRPRSEILKHTLTSKDRPMRIAAQSAAIRDLVRSGRNSNMIVEDDFELDEV